MLLDMNQHDTSPPLDVPALTVTEAAALLRVRRRWVVAAVLIGQLPTRRRGLHLTIPTQELMASFGAPLNTKEHAHDR